VDAGKLELAAEFLRGAREVVVFTGAGVSAESGIATFRDEGGFWNEFPPDEFATMPGLLKVAAARPKRLAEFLLAVLEPVANAMPNAAHRAIARLESNTGITIITQNIDGLHQEAGSTIVHEVHGSLFEIVRGDGRFLRLINRRELLEIVESLRQLLDKWLVLPRLMAAVQPIIGLSPTSIHRPKIVLFGEAMAEPAWSMAVKAAQACNVMLVVGTSGMVHPAAMLPSEARAAGARIIDIGFEAGAGDVWLRGAAGEILPALATSAFP
jgi:NAD-dependent protein deacetylase/lipoamidase